MFFCINVKFWKINKLKSYYQAYDQIQSPSAGEGGTLQDCLTDITSNLKIIEADVLKKDKLGNVNQINCCQ